jgi:Ohr subfamily peroxiredoxin
MNPMADALYKTKAISQGGRAGGKVALADGGLSFHMEHSKGLGGSGEGTNPEELFALGWANCFNSAVAFVAGQKKIDASKAVVTCDRAREYAPDALVVTARRCATCPVRGARRAASRSVPNDRSRARPSSVGSPR